jgi:hypothetical protein
MLNIAHEDFEVDSEVKRVTYANFGGRKGDFLEKIQASSLFGPYFQIT